MCVGSRPCLLSTIKILYNFYLIISLELILGRQFNVNVNQGFFLSIWCKYKYQKNPKYSQFVCLSCQLLVVGIHINTKILEPISNRNLTVFGSKLNYL